MTQPPAGLAAALADRYRIERELGRGGMGTVFLAEDRERGERVAIKVLHTEYAVLLGASRFEQEIAILRGLHHANIVPLLDSNERSPLLYYTTPYIEGESLRELLDRERPLPIAQTLAIAGDVAAALDYAHARNILHRDVKPDNVLLDGPRAVVCDFGIARAIERAGGERISSSGLIIGTPEYMSPEQARGDATLDARTDIYALGCLIYEMLAGEQLFTGPTSQAVIARQIGERPKSLRVVRPEVPAPLEAAVMWALAKDPAARPPSAARLMERLHSG